MRRNEHERTEGNDEHLEPEEAEALEYAKGIKDFYSGLACFAILAIVFFTVMGFDEPVLYMLFGGIGLWLIVQGMVAFEIIRLPFQDLERRIAEKKLGRKL